MSIPAVDVYRLRAGTVTDHGTTIADWANAEQVCIPGCVVQPLTGEELLAHRDTVKVAMKLWAPEGTDLTSADRITVGELTFDVKDVQTWTGNRLQYVSAILTLWEG